MEAWKKFEQSGKIEDYLAYCRAQKCQASCNPVEQIEISNHTLMGGSHGTETESDGNRSFFRQCW